MKKNVDLRSLLTTAVICVAVWMGLELLIKPLISPPPSTPVTSVASPAVILPKGDKIDPRIPFENAFIKGSLTLKGALIDEIYLKNYRKTHDPKSDPVHVLSPVYEEKSYYAQFPWIGAQTEDLPNENTVWHASHPQLTKDQPVTLSWTNKEGIVFALIVRLDESYGLTVEQKATHKGTKPIAFGLSGQLCRGGPVDIGGHMMLYEGPLGVFSSRLKELDYKKVQTLLPIFNQPLGATEKAKGWLGFTDKYWLSALVPSQESVGKFTFDQGQYQATATLPLTTLEPGKTISQTWHLFVGPKNLDLLESYEKKWSIDKFDLALDFGWFYFLTKPLLILLVWFKNFFGNFGWAILAMTVLVKMTFFPLAIRGQKSTARMRLVQMHLQTLKNRYGDDKARFNQEVMAYYKKEKINPLSSFLPFLIQIPVFFALYKVLFVSIEMRQASFWWIYDLAEPDPTSFFNGFGLFGWSVPDMLKIGLWPILMGITMAVQQAFNSAKTSMERQQKVMLTYILPAVFTVMLARFPVGLVIYWTWSNILTIGQQWIIQRFWQEKTL